MKMLFEHSFPAQWGGLLGASSALAIAQLRSKSEKPILVICDSDETAYRLQEDFVFFSEFLKHSHQAYVFPMRQSALHPAMVEDREHIAAHLSSLHELLENDQALVIASVGALSQYTIPKKTFVENTGLVQVGEEFPRDDFIKQLSEAGYLREHSVMEPGSFAVRGSIIDVFLPHAGQPVRLEYFDDEIESIRSFDPDTQQSTQQLSEFAWIPAREILIQEENISVIQSQLKQLCDDRGLSPQKRLPINETLENQSYSPVYQRLFPIFYEEKQTILDYVKANTQFVIFDEISIGREKSELERNIEERSAQLSEEDTICALPNQHFISLDQNWKKVNESPLLKIADIKLEGAQVNFKTLLHNELRQTLLSQRKKEKPLEALMHKIQSWLDQGLDIFILGEAESDCKRLKNILSQYIKNLGHEQSNVNIVQGHISQGFEFPEAGLVFICSSEIFGQKKKRSKSRVKPETSFNNLAELKPGDALVHIDFGVGIFQGLEHVSLNKTEGDFLHIQYAGGDKLFLPVYRLNRVHKYMGADGKKPHVDKLGNQSAWEKTKQKAKKAVEEMAHELIALYAKRAVASTEVYGQADNGYMAFEEEFPFEETRDQLTTLDQVFGDLQSSRPMDRLVCGDVGFGKTEIALRAAFRTAMEGKQTAILVPTTVLCQQHYQTFAKRMENYPIRVDFLSRFKSKAEQKEVIQKLKEGTLDIVVGTHRLLSKDISFSDLGLLVLDEEHRFGVKHKEAIQQYRNKVNVLTLTATPIPRTLQMSMSGIRDLSVINTPPLDRKSIQTFLCKNDDGLIRDAIRKEIARGGQCFFIHNRVETIDAIHEYLNKLVPEARIIIAHGQMTERELEKRMLTFLNKECDVLLATTIVESGLDIPEANTILINRADMFGLAQLYQLRGRVGRSDRSAYCYLLIPGEEIISSDALKRLKALQQFTELGSGLKIAMHDLEIRGAGNLLGKSQSGHIANVGFEMYTQLLEREVRKLKGEKVEEEIEPEIQTSMPAYMPSEYLTDSKERLIMYKRLSGAKDQAELENLQNEIQDRFGSPPQVVQNLYEVIELKILARNAGVKMLRLSTDKPMIEFVDNAPVNIDKLLQLVQKNKDIQLRPDQKLTLDLQSPNDVFAETKSVLEKLI